MNDTAAKPLMLPLMLDVTDVPAFVIGNGDGALTRLNMLFEHGAQIVHVFAETPNQALIDAAGARLIARWPTAEDFKTLAPRLVFSADAPEEVGVEVNRLGKGAGAFVHVQDRIPLCDFHLPARLRRGHLLVTVSTDGAAAGLSRLLRDHLAANVFGPEWTVRMAELAEARRQWKAQGIGMSALFDAISRHVADRGWLSPRPGKE